MKTLSIVLRGLSPLLMHNPLGSMRSDTGAIGRKQIPTPEQEAAASRYVTSEGTLYLPAVAVRNSILSGAVGMRIGKIKAAMPLGAALVLNLQEFPLTDEAGEFLPADGYEVDLRRAVVQRQGILRARASVPLPWFVACEFDYNADWATIEQIRSVAERAGQIIGLGDYRPAKSGWFGRYSVAAISAD